MPEQGEALEIQIALRGLEDAVHALELRIANLTGMLAPLLRGAPFGDRVQIDAMPKDQTAQMIFNQKHHVLILVERMVDLESRIDVRLASVEDSATPKQ